MATLDLVVIGGGNTGLSAAHRVAGAGRKVALVDRGPVGGLCSLAGCNPKKVLVRATEVLDEVRRCANHGISTGEVRIDWGHVIERKKTFTDPVSRQTAESLAASGIELVTGRARFTAPNRIAVGDRELEAAAFIIATGSHPRTLAFDGAELVSISDDALELRDVPKRAVIIGAGVVAFEIGFVYARLGSEVTIVARGERALPAFDEVFLAPVLRFAESLGIRFAWSARVERVRRDRAGLAVDLVTADGTRTVAADFVLNAAGRIAALEDLDLPRASVEATALGVATNEFLQSRTNPRVYAGGDVRGEHQLSPVASYEGRLIARNLLDGNVQKVDYTSLAQVVFTTPALARTGLTAEQAAKRGIDAETAEVDMTTWTVFAIAGDERARARTVVDRRSGRLLGAQIWAHAAPEMIQFLAMALRAGLTRGELEDFVYAYPTTTSALAYAFRPA